MPLSTIIKECLHLNFKCNGKKALFESFFIISYKITSTQDENCDTPFSMEDLKQSLSHMSNDKVSVLVDFPYEFYKEF